MVTGPPGAGKSTVAQVLADQLERSVLVEGDAFFRFVRSGAIDPWLPGSDAQNLVVTRAVAAAAGRFSKGGFDTVYDGVVGPWFLATFAAATGLDRLGITCCAAAGCRTEHRAGGAPARPWLHRSGRHPTHARTVRLRPDRGAPRPGRSIGRCRRCRRPGAETAGRRAAIGRPDDETSSNTRARGVPASPGDRSGDFQTTNSRKALKAVAASTVSNSRSTTMYRSSSTGCWTRWEVTPASPRAAANPSKAVSHVSMSVIGCSMWSVATGLPLGPDPGRHVRSGSRRLRGRGCHLHGPGAFAWRPSVGGCEPRTSQAGGCSCSTC